MTGASIDHELVIEFESASIKLNFRSKAFRFNFLKY